MFEECALVATPVFQLRDGFPPPSNGGMWGRYVEWLPVRVPHLVHGRCRIWSGSHVARSGTAISTKTIRTMITNIGIADFAMKFIS